MTVSRFCRLFVSPAVKVSPFAGPIRRAASYVSIVKQTAPVVAPHVAAIVDDFYPRMFKNNPETKTFFNPANQFSKNPAQRQALSHAVLAYAMNIDKTENLTDTVNLIAHKHCALGVQPEHYAIVHKNLMESIAHVLGDAVTPEIGEGWSQAVLALAQILIDTEKAIYKKANERTGGWVGKRDFKISAIDNITENVKEFTFEPADGSTGPIDFTTGQYLTVHVDKEGATPRHYTVTSAPGKSSLKCCIKLIEGGFVSSHMHGAKVGDSISLSAPFGTFGFRGGPAVLISAGIGVTPMKAIIEEHGRDVRLALHVDHSQSTHPFRSMFEQSGVETKFCYTQVERRPTVDELVEASKPHLADCDFYLCAPKVLLKPLSKALREAGAKSVNLDTFGPA